MLSISLPYSNTNHDHPHSFPFLDVTRSFGNSKSFQPGYGDSCQGRAEALADRVMISQSGTPSRTIGNPLFLGTHTGAPVLLRRYVEDEPNGCSEHATPSTFGCSSICASERQHKARGTHGLIYLHTYVQPRYSKKKSIVGAKISHYSRPCEVDGSRLWGRLLSFVWENFARIVPPINSCTVHPTSGRETWDSVRIASGESSMSPLTSTETKYRGRSWRES